MEYGYTLGRVVNEVNRLENIINRLEQAMHHTSPSTLDAIRRNKSQLKNMLEFILNLEVKSDSDLQALLIAHKNCIQECISATYTTKKPYLGRTRII